MNIRSRLLAGSLITTGFVACIVVVGAGAIEKIKRSVHQLTETSTPAQVKTLELQQVVEKISADFMRLSVAKTASESRAISETVSKRVAALRSLVADLQRLGVKVAGMDPAAFGTMQQRIAGAVDERHKGGDVFRTEIDAVNASLVRVSQIASGVGERTSSLKAEASKKLLAAQTTSVLLNATIKKALTLQTKLKDIELLLTSVDAAKNKFRLAPIAERAKGIADSVQGMGRVQGEPRILAEAKERVEEIRGRLTREGTGLLALKAKSLLADPESEGAYASLKNEIQQLVGALSVKLYEAVDPLELQLAKGHQDTTAAVSFQDGAEKVSALSYAVTLETRELSDHAKRVMMAGAEADIETALAGAAQSEGRLLKGAENLKSVLSRMGQAALAANVARITEASSDATRAIRRIADVRRGVLSSEVEMLRVSDSIKAAALNGEEQVKNLAERQRRVVDEVGRTVRGSMSLMVAISAAVVALILVVNRQAAGSIIRGIRIAEDLIGTVATGDFTKRSDVKSDDEIGRMCRKLNGLVEKLCSSLSSVACRTEIVATSIAEQGTTSEQMSRRAAVLADEANALSAAAQQLASTVVQVSQTIASASEFADRARETAVGGARVITDAVTGINRVSGSIQQMLELVEGLSASSSQVGSVVSVITDIAEQTNLLALNAAIEAARAGVQGRGFAVVADEVRKLAEKTASSTTEIDRIVRTMQESAGKVGAAMKSEAREIAVVAGLATDSSDSLERIVESVERISSMSASIAVAAEEQTGTVGTISDRVEQVFQTAQEFSTGMEQIAAATDEVGRAASELRELVEEFKVA